MGDNRNKRKNECIGYDKAYFQKLGRLKGYSSRKQQPGLIICALWRKADKKPALNADLWEKLLILIEQHNVTLEWVKGHNGHPENERCDALAVMEYQKYL